MLLFAVSCGTIVTLGTFCVNNFSVVVEDISITLLSDRTVLLELVVDDDDKELSGSFCVVVDGTGVDGVSGFCVEISLGFAVVVLCGFIVKSE